MTAKTGSSEEAAKLYRKIYYLNTTSESQAAAALAAGEIYYQTEDFGLAQKWLTQYIDLGKGKDVSDKDISHAYYMLGKACLGLGKTEAACVALQKAVGGHLPKQEYVDAISALVQGCIEAGKICVGV